MGGVVLDWVFTVEGGARVRVCQDGQGVMWGGRNESGWVRIGESLTSTHISRLKQANNNNGQQMYNSKICKRFIQENGKG